MYVQCRLRKGNKFDISWVEAKFAIEGKKVRIKRDGEDWEDGWVVDKTYGKASKESVETMKDLYKNHRKGTDI